MTEFLEINRGHTNTFDLLPRRSESRNALAGTRFVMLLRHSTLRSTLDVYTQAITPAKHAAQAAVLSLVFSTEANPT